MKNLYPISFVFVFIISMSALAQNSILWEVTGNGLSQTSYLLGSLKFIGEKEYVLHKEISDRLKISELFAIEDEVDQRAQHELNKAIHFPKGETLANVLSVEDYAQLQIFFQTQFNIPRKKFKKSYAKLKPLALSIAMTRLALMEDMKYYDIELLKMANQINLETYSLEAIDREAESFNTFPMEDQAKALLHSLNNFSTQKEEYLKLEAAYVKGDIDKVFEYSLHLFENNEQFIEEFYTKRNLEWMPKIEKMLADHKAFISVGVSHLKGKKGLLTLLREKGYTLTPIPVTN